MKTERCWKTVKVTSSNLGVKHFNCRVHDGSESVRDRSVYVCLCVYASPYIQLIKGKRSPFCCQITEDPNAFVREITWNTLLILKPPEKNIQTLAEKYHYISITQNSAAGIVHHCAMEVTAKDSSVAAWKWLLCENTESFTNFY